MNASCMLHRAPDGHREPTPRPAVPRRVSSRAVHWFSTGLLIALSAGTAAWAGWLLRRLFVVEPAAVPGPDPDPERDPDDHHTEERTP